MFTGQHKDLHLHRITRPEIIDQLEANKKIDADLTCLLFVMSLLVDRQNPIKTNGNGPKHAPIVIWEDCHTNLDYDVLNYDSGSN